ncbi:MAG: hypothetical protein ACYTGC_07550 [Planctomycetota bacterium]
MNDAAAPPPTPGTSRALLVTILLALASMAALVAVMPSLVIEPAAATDAGRENLRHLWPFWIASAALWISLTALWCVLHRRRARGRDHAARPVRAAALVLGAAALARVVVLVGHDPVLSDDIFRYAFDGRNLAAGWNPYLVTPDDRRDAAAPRWPGEGEVVTRMNNTELATIYLPSSQWLFAGVAWIMPRAVHDALEAARWYRTMLTVLELGAMALVLLALRRGRRSPWWLALYAWHPLAITEIAGSGHQESLGLLLLVAALCVATATTGPGGAGRVAAWSALLAGAALVKPVVLPIAPLLLRGRRWTLWASSLAVGAVTCLALAGPLWLAGSGEALANLGATATRFSLKWAHFGSIYEPVLWSIERLMPGPNDPQEQLARALCTGLLALVVIAIIVRSRDVWAGARSMLFAMVLFTPAAHPWYMLWSLILLPRSPSVAVWIGSLTISWGYAAWGFRLDDKGEPGWGVSPWLLVAAYAPVYAALLWSALRSSRREDAGRDGA